MIKNIPNSVLSLEYGEHLWTKVHVYKRVRAIVYSVCMLWRFLNNDRAWFCCDFCRTNRLLLRMLFLCVCRSLRSDLDNWRKQNHVIGKKRKRRYCNRWQLQFRIQKEQWNIKCVLTLHSVWLLCLMHFDSWARFSPFTILSPEVGLINFRGNQFYFYLFE